MTIRRLSTLLRLFGEMFLLSASVLGGGYIILAAADRRFSRRPKILRAGELFDVLPLFQMIPGIIGGHTAVYVGNRVAGPLGAAVALAGTILPSLLIFLTVALLYRNLPVSHGLLKAAFLGLRAALAGLMTEIIVRTWKKSVAGLYGYVACPIAAALMLLRLVPPVDAILLAMAAGILIIHLAPRAPDVPDVPCAAATKPPFRLNGILLVPLLFAGYGLIAFGGGFTLVPIFMRDFVGAAAPYLKLSATDFANVMALTEMTPGPVAINCATFFGYHLGGVIGSVLATGALVMPGALILLLALKSIARFQANAFVRGIFFGVRPVSMALMLIADWAFLSMSAFAHAPGAVHFSPAGTLLVIGSFAAARSRRLPAAAVILLSAAIALGAGLIFPGSI